MDKSITITLIIAGTIILLAALGWIGIALLVAPANTVDAQGISEVKAMPDIVSIYFTIETNGTTAADASSKNADISDKVNANLLALGIAKASITTQNYNIYEDFSYDYQTGQRTSNGFKATNQIKVELTTNQIDLAGKVVDAGANARALVNSIDFELSQTAQNQYKAQALTAATQDARTKAEAIASGLNKKLGALVSVSSSSFDYRPWPIYAMSAEADGVVAAKQAATSIQPGPQSVTASVSVTYKLI